MVWFITVAFKGPFRLLAAHNQVSCFVTPNPINSAGKTASQSAEYNACDAVPTLWRVPTEIIGLSIYVQTELLFPATRGGKNCPQLVPLTGSEPYKNPSRHPPRSQVVRVIRNQAATSPSLCDRGGWYGDRSAKRAFLSNDDEAGCSSANDSRLDEGDDVGARARCAAKQGRHAHRAGGRWAPFFTGWGKRSPAPWTGPRGR